MLFGGVLRCSCVSSFPSTLSLPFQHGPPCSLRVVFSSRPSPLARTSCVELLMYRHFRLRQEQVSPINFSEPCRRSKSCLFMCTLLARSSFRTTTKNVTLDVCKCHPFPRPKIYVVEKFHAASRVPAMHYRHRQLARLVHRLRSPCTHSSAHRLSRKGISSPFAAREPSISAFQAQYSPNRISAYEA